MAIVASRYFDIPFASAGDHTTVPDTVQVDGSVSYPVGYGVLYQTATGSGGLNIERNKMNQIFLDITTALLQWQQNGVPRWYSSLAAGAGYPKFAKVIYSDGNVYQSQVDANADTPGASANWVIDYLGGFGTAAGKAASDNSKTTVASVTGSFTVNNLALFADTAGTIKDGGTPGTAAFKAASDNSKANLASVSGSITTGHIAVFADTSGTVADGGLITQFAASTTSITGVGLATGGGALTTNQAITVTAATKSDMVTATSTTTAVTPAQVKNSPNTVKAWASFDGTTGSILASNGVTSVTKNGTGDYTIAFSTNFTSANYALAFQAGSGSATATAVAGLKQNVAPSAGGFTMQVYQNTSTPGLIDCGIVSFVSAGVQ